MAHPVTKKVIRSPNNSARSSGVPVAQASQDANAHDNEQQNAEEYQGDDVSGGNVGLEEFEQVDDSLVRPSNTVYPYPEILSIPVKEHLLLPSIKAACVNGFVNLGNNCYLNVVLQLLMHSPGVREYFLSNLHIKEHVSGAGAFPDGIVGRIGEIYQLYHSYNDTAFAPHRLLECIAQESGGIFDPINKEDDAVSSMLFILHTLHERLKKIYVIKEEDKADQSDIQTASMSNIDNTGKSKTANSSLQSHFRDLVLASIDPEIDLGRYVRLEAKGPKKGPQGKGEKTALEMASLKSFKEFLHNGSSVVCDTNLGQLLHKVQCADCGFYMVHFKQFFCLEIPLPQDHETVKLHTVFKQMSVPKEVIGRTLDCTTCKGSRKMLSSTELYKMPLVLYVYFRRFVEGQPKNPTLVEVELGGEDFSDIETGAIESTSPSSKKIYKPFFYIVGMT